MSDFVLPRGFRASGVAAGIKSDPTRRDIALLLSDVDCSAAGVFTKNRVVGAPVKVSRGRVPRGTARGVVINAGNANACTGDQGIADAEWMTSEVAKLVGCEPHDILVCSTGVIGRFLPREKLAAGIPQAVQTLAHSPTAFENAARAIMTTDTVPKQATRQVRILGKEVTVSGVCKGAAMIAPNMATMLAIVMTDAQIDPQDAHSLLSIAVDQSFNCISVDEHMSTSDSVLLLANGQSGVRYNSQTRDAINAAINSVCQELAQKIIRDAEGAEHFIVLEITGLRTRADAHRIAKTVADSPLVKTAIAGNDPNWGRVVSAAGYSGVHFEEPNCSLAINGHRVYTDGAPAAHDPQTVSAAMRTGEVHIHLAFNLGQESCRFWTSDLTMEYVRLNSEYTT